MANNPRNELERRKTAALAAIKASYGKPDTEYRATLFVSHHLEQLDAEYWQDKLGTSTPAPDQVLRMLQSSPHWSEEDDDMDILDFTLPGDVTDNVLSVSFDSSGKVESIEMES